MFNFLTYFDKHLSEFHELLSRTSMLRENTYLADVYFSEKNIWKLFITSTSTGFLFYSRKLRGAGPFELSEFVDVDELSCGHRLPGTPSGDRGREGREATRGCGRDPPAEAVPRAVSLPQEEVGG